MPFKKENTHHDKIESLFFHAHHLAYYNSSNLTLRRYQRLENAYAQYVMAVNSNSPELPERRIVINRQLTLFIKSLRLEIASNSSNERNSQWVKV